MSVNHDKFWISVAEDSSPIFWPFMFFNNAIRFGQEKIYLWGYDWGTILGLLMVQSYPELFYAYIGSGQIIDPLRADRCLYHALIAEAEYQDYACLVHQLRFQGEPPYFGKEAFSRYRKLYEKRYELWEKHHLFSLEYWQKRSYFFQLNRPEYNFEDRLRFFKNLVNTFAIFYPQIQHINFLQTVLELRVPIYFCVGQHEFSLAVDLAEAFFKQIEAPKKQWWWFACSEHDQIWSDAEKFQNLMIYHILPETYPPLQRDRITG